MDKPLLNDALTYPTDAVLACALGNSGEAYQAFLNTLPGYHIELVWHYYKDGKAWLGKAISNKKTVFWLSIWQGFFKVSFHFTEKTRLGIMDLPIADDIKTSMERKPLKGKLVSLIIDVSQSTHLKDVFTLLSYKQRCM